MIITSIEQQKNNKNRFSIFVDGNYTFSLEDIDIIKLNIKSGQEINEQDINKYKEIYEYSKAKDKALNFASYKIRSSKEIEKKLIDLGYSIDIIEKVLVKLSDLGYIDDYKFAQLYINDRLKLRPSGKKLLYFELKNKGVNDDTINNLLENIEIDEYEIAYNLALSKIKNIKTFDKKEQQKIYSFILRKGFSNDIALKTIKKLQE